MEADISRMRQIHGVYKEALALPSHARTAFLDARRGADPDLVSSVEALLASAEQVESNSHAVLGTPQAGTQIGPYRLIEQIGQGGVGVVYAAERVDNTAMRVAVKLLKRGMDTEHVLQRFFKERQILAALNHPHIAQLFDAGTTNDGLPYFVMEYVDGEPIDQYCETHQLDLDQRLKLFLGVCEAVRFAHQNLVIHRDLKPANILVTREGHPKMLDFGISGLLDPNTGEPRTATVLNERMLTVEYAAPEQLRGEPLGTPCDLYSLGIILYQLITGSRPFHFHSRDPFFAARQICAGQPEKPSARIRIQAKQATQDHPSGSKGVAQTVNRDIDNIVLKTLAADPTQRYRSVDQLMHDIQRYFNGLPVIARPAGVSYVLGKYLMRNRWTICFTTLFFLLIGTAAAVTNHMQRAAQRERDTADQALRFLSDIFAVNDPDQSRGATVTAKDLLDRSTLTIDRDSQNSPAVRSRLMLSMGRAYHGLGLFREAVHHFEKALEDARISHGRASLPVGDILVELARNQHWRSDPNTIKPLLEEALAIRRAHFPDTDPAVWEVLFHLGQNDVLRHDFRAATQWFQAIQNDGSAPLSAEKQYAAALLEAVNGNPEKAETGWLTTLERLEGRFNHPLNSLLHQQLAKLYLDQGRTASAQIHLDQAQTIAGRLFSPHHPVQAEILYLAAELAVAKGDLAGAGRDHQRMVAICQRSLSLDHYLFARAFLLEADIALAQNNYAHAESAYRQAVSISLTHFGSGHGDTARAQLGLAEVFYFTGRTPEAAASANAARQTFADLFTEDYLLTRAATHLAACVQNQSRPNNPATQANLGEARRLLTTAYEGSYWRQRLLKREQHQFRRD